MINGLYLITDAGDRLTERVAAACAAALGRQYRDKSRPTEQQVT
jgi:hypothetical protein